MYSSDLFADYSLLSEIWKECSNAYYEKVGTNYSTSFPLIMMEIIFYRFLTSGVISEGKITASTSKYHFYIADFYVYLLFLYSNEH